jgi:hypothetical protein
MHGIKGTRLYQQAIGTDEGFLKHPVSNLVMY